MRRRPGIGKASCGDDLKWAKFCLQKRPRGGGGSCDLWGSSSYGAVQLGDRCNEQRGTRRQQQQERGVGNGGRGEGGWRESEGRCVFFLHTSSQVHVASWVGVDSPFWVLDGGCTRSKQQCNVDQPFVLGEWDSNVLRSLEQLLCWKGREWDSCWHKVQRE